MVEPTGLEKGGLSLTLNTSNGEYHTGLLGFIFASFHIATLDPS